MILSAEQRKEELMIQFEFIYSSSTPNTNSLVYIHIYLYGILFIQMYRIPEKGSCISDRYIYHVNIFLFAFLSISFFFFFLVMCRAHSGASSHMVNIYKVVVRLVFSLHSFKLHRNEPWVNL